MNTDGADRPEPDSRRIQSLFEFWPRGLFYMPLIIQWIVLGLRYGSMTLPTLVNPRFEAGGLCGESKTRIFAEFGAEGRRCLAAYISFVRAADASAIDRDTAMALDAMKHEGLAFPVIAKPDIGCNGNGVQLLSNERDLCRYIGAFPAGERIILQHWIDEPGEAGLFYIRDPSAPLGFIFSVTLKYFPTITGDGASTVEQLIRSDPRACRIADTYLSRFADRRSVVLGKGEVMRLVLTGNHCKGAVFRDGSHLITPALAMQVERIARGIPQFHFGRFDVRFGSVAALQRGQFKIIEVNGAGSEATHIWDPDTGLIAAYRTLFAQTAMLFSIAAKKRAAGLQPMPVWDLFRFYRRQRRLMSAYPLSH